MLRAFMYLPKSVELPISDIDLIESEDLPIVFKHEISKGGGTFQTETSAASGNIVAQMDADEQSFRRKSLNPKLQFFPRRRE